MACAACSTIPPVQADGYESKGTFETIGGLKTCEYNLYCFQISGIASNFTLLKAE